MIVYGEEFIIRCWTGYHETRLLRSISSLHCTVHKTYPPSPRQQQGIIGPGRYGGASATPSFHNFFSAPEALVLSHSGHFKSRSPSPSSGLRVCILQHTFSRVSIITMDHSQRNTRDSYPGSDGCAERLISQSPQDQEQRRQQPTSQAAFVASLTLSFASGSAVLLAATLLWHSELVVDASTDARDAIVGCPAVQMACALYRRRRRTGCYMTL